METTKQILQNCEERMQKGIDFFEETLLNIRAGKASVGVLNGLMVDYYGTPTGIDKVASVNVPDARTILIKPWEKSMLAKIEKVIINGNIGLTPSNNGEEIRLNIPPLTEERRKLLVKQVREEAERGRVSLRNSRRDAVEVFKKAQKDGMPEDEAKAGEGEVQKVSDRFTKKIDEVTAAQEKEIMTV
jgi:ribosome recycling factor